MANESIHSPAPSTVDLSGLPEGIVQCIKQLVDSIRDKVPSGGELGEIARRPPLRGRFADLKLTLLREAIDEAQREAWANFPHDFPEPDKS